MILGEPLFRVQLPMAALALNREIVLAGCRKAVPTLRQVVLVTLPAKVATIALVVVLLNLGVGAVSAVISPVKDVAG